MRYYDVIHNQYSFLQINVFSTLHLDEIHKNNEKR